MIASQKSARRSELEVMLYTDAGTRQLYAMHRQLCPEMHEEYLKNGILFDYMVDDILAAESQGSTPHPDLHEFRKIAWFVPHGIASSG